MATKIGPKTVTQRDRSKNLVFCIDAAHFDSYGGQPTDNLLADPNNFGGGDWNVKNGTWAVSNDPGPHGNGAYSCTATDSDPFGYSSFVRSVSTGNVTFSAWVKGEGATIGMGGDIRINFGSSGGQATGTNATVNYTITGEWQKVTVTQNVTGAGTIKVGVEAPNSAAVGNVVYFSDPQLEQTGGSADGGTISTPFTATARTTSNAVKNISGVGAQGTTITGDFSNGPYGQELFRPANRKVLASFNINQGHIGGAFWDFDGSDECIVIPYDDDSSLNLTRGTIIAWFKASGGGHNGTIVGWGSAGTDNFGNIAITSNWTGAYADESLAYNRYRGSAAQIAMYIRKGGNFYANSAWHCVAVTSHGGASDLGRIYIDGELQTVTTTSNIADSHPFMNMKDSTAKFLNIGRRPYSGGAEEFNGEIANTMIWSSSLTSKEIKDIYIAQKGRFGK